MYEEFVAEAMRRGRCLPERRVRVAATDGTALLAGVFGDDPDAEQVMVFFHGAGANMNVGYLDMAKDVREHSRMAVLLPDLRGHGMSGGDRGFAHSKEQVWLDVDAWLAFARARYPKAELILGGHSAGAALLLNYLTRHERRCHEPVSRLVMVAPYWGIRRSESEPVSADDPSMQIPQFANSDLQVFMAYALSGDERYRKQLAVHFNYPPDMAAVVNLVPGYTPEMAMAVSPRHVQQQLARLTQPLLVLAAECDALFSPESLQAVLDAVQPVAQRQQIAFQHIGGDHLTCLYGLGAPLANWLDQASVSAPALEQAPSAEGSEPSVTHNGVQDPSTSQSQNQSQGAL